MGAGLIIMLVPNIRILLRIINNEEDIFFVMGYTSTYRNFVNGSGRKPSKPMNEYDEYGTFDFSDPFGEFLNSDNASVVILSARGKSGYAANDTIEVWEDFLQKCERMASKSDGGCKISRSSRNKMAYNMVVYEMNGSTIADIDFFIVYFNEKKIRYMHELL